MSQTVTKPSSSHDIQQSLAYNMKLHDMLDDMEALGCESIVSWLPHGRAFRVHQPKEFANRIMPKYFKQSKYKSFQRQLHIYGFRRQGSRKRDYFGAYYHEQFVRSEKHTSLLMKRQKQQRHKESIKTAGCKTEEVDDDDYAYCKDKNEEESAETGAAANSSTLLSKFPPAPQSINTTCTTMSAPSMVTASTLSHNDTNPYGLQGSSMVNPPLMAQRRNSSAHFHQQSNLTNFLLQPKTSSNGGAVNRMSSFENLLDGLDYGMMIMPTPLSSWPVTSNQAMVSAARNQYHEGCSFQNHQGGDNAMFLEGKKFFDVQEGSTFCSQTCPDLEPILFSTSPPAG